MPQDPHALSDLSVLEMIEQSAVGAVPFTPSYQAAIRRLYASHLVYASADHKHGHVTARSLGKAPVFFANNLDALVNGSVEAAALESNASIFARYVQSLPEALRTRAEGYATAVVGRSVHHRKHHGLVTPGIHDPLHSLFLVPGGGVHHGLPGNYLHGLIVEIPHPGAAVTWAVRLQDDAGGAATFEADTQAEALEKMQEVLGSVPFALGELATLGFKSNQT